MFFPKNIINSVRFRLNPGRRFLKPAVLFHPLANLSFPKLISSCRTTCSGEKEIKPVFRPIKPFAVKVDLIPAGETKERIEQAFEKFKPVGVQLMSTGISALVYFDSEEDSLKAADQLNGFDLFGNSTEKAADVKFCSGERVKVTFNAEDYESDKDGEQLLSSACDVDGGQLLSATVEEFNPDDNTYSVLYENGTKEEDVAAYRLLKEDPQDKEFWLGDAVKVMPGSKDSKSNAKEHVKLAKVKAYNPVANTYSVAFADRKILEDVPADRLSKAGQQVTYLTPEEVRPLRWNQGKRERYIAKEQITAGNPLTEYDTPSTVDLVERTLDLAGIKGDFREDVASFREFLNENEHLDDEQLLQEIDNRIANIEYERKQIGDQFRAMGVPNLEEVQFMALCRRRADRARRRIEQYSEMLEGTAYSNTPESSPVEKEHAEYQIQLLENARELLEEDFYNIKTFSEMFPRDAWMGDDEIAPWFSRIDIADDIELEHDMTEEDWEAFFEQERREKASGKNKNFFYLDEEWEDAPTPESLSPPEEKASRNTKKSAEHDKEQAAESDEEPDLVPEDDENWRFYKLPGREGPWSVCWIKDDSTTKILKGGRLNTMRSFVIVGNLKGWVGYGVGKGAELDQAQTRAIRDAFMNLIYVDRVHGTALTQSLYGKCNNLEVRIFATPVGSGLRSDGLVAEILKHAGIDDASARVDGRKNLHALLRATFNALKTHDSIEHIARKRGKRLLSLEKARLMNL